MEPSLPRRVIGVAASAGGVEALRRLVTELPADLDAALCVVLHIPPTGRSLLAPILDRDSALTAVLAEDGAPLRAGMIYVAPADHHLLVRNDRLELSRGPKENNVRPAADPLLRSLARSWGSCAVAVVLSGALDDGAAGAAVVANAGGAVLVQDPEDALAPGMPSAALSATTEAEVRPLAQLAAAVERVVASAIPPLREEDTVTTEPGPAKSVDGPMHLDGPPTGFMCPECRGPVWEHQEGHVLRYRCRVGHAYSEEAMVDSQNNTVESALWAALEVLEERAALLTRIAVRPGTHDRTRARFERGAREAAARAENIRRVLVADEASVA
ncbi:two-component system chemotaxis response regulator CheB [Solirubrobacter pauli]|uniref:protein-glutamate methylesterase n=1 Tax=Solirubrobacter pauli TaxID=166793 RepID=A0A660LI17_9ACTN|nr:chemotaxis protein CheB [Solirubrobacter pauli]RKQ93925.1 two-component system chemotaxis response regulator CheB [Solirubrobacter pauli]